MRLLGNGTLSGLKARGLAKQERDPILRNQRIREETQRAHMRTLMAVPPAKFPGGELGRIELFQVNLIRVAPAKHQLPVDELPGALEPVRAGVAMHMDPSGKRLRFSFAQVIGPWAVCFTIYEATPTQEVA